MAIDEDPDTIVVRWSPKPADLRELLRRPAVRRRQAATLLLPALLYVAVATWATQTLPLSYTAAMVLVVATALLAMFLIPQRLQRIRWQTDPLTREPVEYIFDGQGVQRRQTDYECRWGWNRIRTFEESRTSFLLQLGDGNPVHGPLLLIAKRGITSPTSEARLREMLYRHTSPSKPTTWTTQSPQKRTQHTTPDSTLLRNSTPTPDR